MCVFLLFWNVAIPWCAMPRCMLLPFVSCTHKPFNPHIFVQTYMCWTWRVQYQLSCVYTLFRHDSENKIITNNNKIIMSAIDTAPDKCRRNSEALVTWHMGTWAHGHMGTTPPMSWGICGALIKVPFNLIINK